MGMKGIRQHGRKGLREKNEIHAGTGAIVVCPRIIPRVGVELAPRVHISRVTEVFHGTWLAEAAVFQRITQCLSVDFAIGKSFRCNRAQRIDAILVESEGGAELFDSL
jgi:hypothetical protein